MFINIYRYRSTLILTCTYCSVVMELIEGVNLERYLKTQQGQRMSWKDVLTIARDVANAMAYIHSKNVLHLDLRCANVLVRTYLLLLLRSDSIIHQIKQITFLILPLCIIYIYLSIHLLDR